MSNDRASSSEAPHLAGDGRHGFASVRRASRGDRPADVLYRMSHDWREMRFLAGNGLIPDTTQPEANWCDKYIPTEQQAAVQQAIRQAIDAKSVFELEHQVRRVDGSTGWISSRAVPILDAKGEIIEWLGAASEISRRIDAKPASAQTQRVYEAILTNTPDLAYVFDRNHRFIYANEGLLKMWGKRWEDAIGKNCLELGYEPWHAAMHDREIDAVVATKQPIRGEVPFSGTFGRRIYDYIFVPVFGEDGEVEAVAGTTRDVTDRKHVEEAVARLAAIVDSSEDAIISKTLDGTITSWNAAAELMFGYKAHEAVGKPILMLFPPNLVDEEAKIIDQIRRGEPIRHYQTVRLRKDGTQIHLSMSISPIRDTQGKVVGAAKIARDISQQIQQQQEREALLESERAARSEAERSNLLKDEFLATLSHELRTPLNAILGWSQLLSAQHDAADLDEGLKAIQRNARAQTQLIEDLLDMSRIVSGKVRLDVQWTGLPSVIDAAIESVRPSADAKGIRLRKILDPHAGPVSGDPTRLQQIVWNLLSNAIKFTPKGGKVDVLLERVNSHLEITVHDSGIGIKPEFLSVIFDRFRQVDSSTTRVFGGLGLGLSIVKHLVELHGGTVRAKSPGEGQGSTFIVALPLAPFRPDETRVHPKSSQASNFDRTAVDLHGVKIMVVDDEADTRTLVARLLTECKAEVLAVGGAAEAIAELQRYKPDLMISDIGMPGMDGYQLIQAIRESESTPGDAVPAIALTAFARSEDRTRAMMAGYNMHIAKPIEAQELLATVANLAGRRNARR